MHSKTRPSRSARHAAPPARAKAPPLRAQVEDYVREHPFKSMGQAAAVGCVLRFLPLRSLVATGLRMAGPLLCLSTLWKACERLEKQ